MTRPHAKNIIRGAAANAGAGREQFRSRFKELQDEHRRALDAGDIGRLDRIQTDLAEVMKHAPSRDRHPSSTAPTMNKSELREHHEREAGRLRSLAANATTSALRARLLDEAGNHDLLAKEVGQLKTPTA